MARVLVLAVAAFLVFLIIRASLRSFVAGLRGGTPRGPGRPATRDELVRDPVCQTYVPRKKAIPRSAGTATYYFCSRDCADKFAART